MVLPQAAWTNGDQPRRIGRMFPSRTCGPFFLFLAALAVGMVALAGDRQGTGLSAPAPGNDALPRGMQLLLDKAYLPPEFDDEVFDHLWYAWEEPLRRQAEAATPAERRKMAYARYGFTPRPSKTDDRRPLQYTAHGADGWSANCFACHGPDSASRKAGLRIDRQKDVIEAGAIAPGKPEESELIKRIFSADPEEVMPPAKSHKTLTAAQKDLLKRWVASGAEYQPHWSLIAPTRPASPAVKNESWSRVPFDKFILAKLESMGLEPAPEADRRKRKEAA